MIENRLHRMGTRVSVCSWRLLQARSTDAGVAVAAPKTRLACVDRPTRPGRSLLHPQEDCVVLLHFSRCATIMFACCSVRWANAPVPFHPHCDPGIGYLTLAALRVKGRSGSSLQLQYMIGQSLPYV